MFAFLVETVIAALRGQLTLPHRRPQTTLRPFQIILGVQGRIEVASMVTTLRRFGCGCFVEKGSRLLGLVVGAICLDALRLMYRGDRAKINLLRSIQVIIFVVVGVDIGVRLILLKRVNTGILVFRTSSTKMVPSDMLTHASWRLRLAILRPRPNIVPLN